MGFLFTALIVTVIGGIIIQSAHDELHTLWCKIIDTLHHSPAEQYYKQLRDRQFD
jgi:hypothetical protein